MIPIGYDGSFHQRLIQLSTKIAYRKELKRLKNNYRLLERVVRHCSDKHELDRKDGFLKSYLILANKLVIDLVSCRILLERGLYGSAHALLAVILRTVRMAGALHLKSDLIDDFLNEEKDSDSDHEFMRRFSEGSLQRILDGRFGKMERGKYANIEKTLHGSSVGSIIFYSRIRQNPDGTKGGDLIFDAFLENEKAGAIIGLLCGALIDMVGIYIEKYQAEQAVREMEEEYKILLRAETRALVTQELLLRRVGP